MPIIASHHKASHPLAKDTHYHPSQDWPEDCHVQWGGRGVVLSDKGNYQTAFFEASPEDQGFFRGEGKTIEDAEKACFERYHRYSQCTHIWGRGSYLNGGAICRKCGAFASVMKPVTSLGAYRRPLTCTELLMAAEGQLRYVPASRFPPKTKKSLDRHSRKVFLRMRLAGVDLPETEEEPASYNPFSTDDDDPYILACRKAVCDWYRKHYVGDEMVKKNSMAGVFKAFEKRTLELILEEDEAYHGATPDIS